MVQMALVRPAQQWYSHLPLDIKKTGKHRRTFDIQESQTQAKLLLENITCASGEKIKTLALRIEQITRKAYVNNAPGMRNAQMNEALVKAFDPQLTRIAQKIANHKKKHWNHSFHSHNLLKRYTKKTLQEDIFRHKLNTNSTLSPSINNLSLEIDNVR